jgi:uncharacterized membrane protein YbhN (UPF0104 family)
MLHPIVAHLICIALVVIDMVARMFRIQWFLKGVGAPITLWQAFTLNAYGDAACAITPARIGGEPARVAGMVQAKVPATAGTVAVLFEVITAWPVVILMAGALAWLYAPEWWANVRPRLQTMVHGAWPVLILVAVMSLAAWWLGRRIAKRGAPQLRNPLRRAMVYWRRMPRWPMLASIPMSFLNVATRTALLPVLALTLPHPPSIGPMLFGSFALLYSQLVLPTPSGAGAVDVGFLGGMAGDFGGDQQLLLIAWRFYANFAGVAIGAWLAIQSLGWPAFRAMVRKSVTEGV